MLKKKSDADYYKSSFYKRTDISECTVKLVYKGLSREPENVPFMSSFPLYKG